MNVHELRELLGPVVFIDWPLRKKGTAKKWGHLTVDHMTPAYLRKCERGNIGVALGRVSGDLVVLDVDVDTLVLPYLAVNPGWKDTLTTHGARGCGFWLRMAGDYPQRTLKLRTRSGEDAGEFRSNGSQSIIHGIHPNGNPYQIVKKARPVTVCFDQIVWPTQIANPPKHETTLIQRDRETEPHRDRETDVTEAISVRACSLLSIEEAVQLALPSKVHQNNDRLFTLARAVKGLEVKAGKFTPAQLQDVFSRWYKLAAEFLRPEQSRDDYLTQFMNSYSSAKVPLGEGVITQAWQAAQAKPLPPEAVAMFQDEPLRRVVALCRELQIIAGKEPFYLSARTLQQLLKQEGHATAARWLRSLCVLQILDEVEKGTGVRASRYKYKGVIE